MAGVCPRLHPEVELRQFGKGAFAAVDRRSRRPLPVDLVQLEVLRALDGSRDAEAIAAEVLGDPESGPLVAAFVEKLRAFGLLEDSADGEPAAALLDEMRGRRDRRVVQMVRWAASSIPFHRERLAPLADGVAGYDDLPTLPIMGKKEIRESFPTGLLPEGVDVDELVSRGAATLEATSGTSEDRLQIFHDHTRPGYHLTFPGIWPLAGGWSGARIAVFTTPICSGTVCHLGGMGYDDRLDGELTLNSSDRVMRLERRELEGILADWDRFSPTVLRCDPVYAAALVRAFERERLPVPRVAAVWTSFEYCSHLHRQILAAGFGAPVFDYFGGTDVGGSEAAFRCENGRHHVWEDAYAFEFVRGDHRVKAGELGEILVTSLRNRVMPVIRYRIGDLGRPLEGRCGCAHDYWSAFELEGRAKDCIADSAGATVTTRAVDELFAGLGWVDFYQLLQAGDREYELFAVKRPEGATAGPPAGAGDEGIFRERAARLLGPDAKLRIRYVREIPPEKSLKYRLTGRAQPL